LDKARDGDKRESIDNRERGCGHLKPRSCYLRSDVAALSADGGDIPRFVELDDPVEYREHTGRGAIIPGWKAFPGNSFAAHYEADGRTTTPTGDISAHFERLSRFGFDGKHFANITSAQSHDVLMSVGATNWETPDDYIDECRDRGLNLKIPVSDSSPPPIVEPLRTRVWVIHPNGAGENRPAIIGYAYLTRNVFTSGTEATADDGDVPGWAEDFAEVRDDFDLVDRGEPIAEDDPAFDRSQTRLADHDPFDGTIDDPEPEGEHDRDVATVTVADDDGAGDVSGLEVEFGRGDIPVSARTESFESAVDDGPISYNALKVIASNRDEADVDAQPSQDDLIGALVDDAFAFVPAYLPDRADEDGVAPVADGGK
jgi:hypothetical protein